MASILPNLTIFFFFFLLLAASAAGDAFNFGKEKKTHLRFYFHDINSGPEQSTVDVAQASTTNTSFTRFGAIVMADDVLTEGPELSSRLIGRAQGVYTYSSQEEIGLLMVFNFAFVAGEFNGSTLTMVGRNTVFSKVREMPIVGGSGKFRLARGFALASTHSLSAMAAVVEYNVYVLHY